MPDMKRPRADWADLREKLWKRSGGRCEVSGVELDPLSWDAHHRRNKGMGGTYREDTDTLPNLLVTHPLVHNLSPDSVHGNPEWSRPLGYLLGKDHEEQPPALVPIKLHQVRWVLLTANGGYLPLP
jgi:hypothetical protein